MVQWSSTKLSTSVSGALTLSLSLSLSTLGLWYVTSLLARGLHSQAKDTGERSIVQQKKRP